MFIIYLLLGWKEQNTRTHTYCCCRGVTGASTAAVISAVVSAVILAVVEQARKPLYREYRDRFDIVLIPGINSYALPW